MPFFKNQLANVIEWNETRGDILFWMWRNQEIKKGSRLIVRPGQNAIFLHNGRIEGIFAQEGSFDVESDIIPFLTTLKSFKFGFSTPLRAEILFVNTKESLIRWGTKSPINLPAPGLKGGMPIRCHGTFTVKITDYTTLIDRIAGIKQQFTVEDVQERVVSKLNPLLMSWITREGKDMFNLQVNANEISKGILGDLNEELGQIGMTATTFKVTNFSYPENIQKMIEKTASFDMVSDVDHFQKMSMIESLNQPGGGNSMVNMGAQMAMGAQMMQQMSGTFQNPAQTGAPVQQQSPAAGTCQKCGAALAPGAKFCANCGTPVAAPAPVSGAGFKFCSECGAKVDAHAKFCPECGKHL